MRDQQLSVDEGQKEFIPISGDTAYSVSRYKKTGSLL